MSLAAKRCFNHPERGAVIRCLECGHFFCRECAGEYHDRFLCTNCLLACQGQKPPPASSLLARLHRVAAPLIGLFCCWLVFYGLGRLLYALPTYMHAGFIQHEQEKP